jgi:hypothetical protein
MCFASVEGSVEAAVAAVMQPGATCDDVRLLELMLWDDSSQITECMADAGAATHLLSFVGTDKARSGDALSCAALACLDRLLRHHRRAADQILAADASSFCPVLEAALDCICKGSPFETHAFNVLEQLIKSSPNAARRTAASSGLLAGLLGRYAAGQACKIVGVLEAVVTGAGDEGQAAVLAAAAAAMASASKDKARKRLRKWLKGPPLRVEAPMVSVLERAASVPAALRAHMAELEAVPINTRAAITELAQAVRGKRRRQEGE